MPEMQTEHTLTEFSKDPDAAAREMISTINILSDVYVRETEALENSDTQTFLTLQDEKLLAARNYQHGIETFLKRQEEMKTLSPATKEKLQILQKDFSQLAERNKDAIKRMQRVTERLSDTIRGAAKEAIKKQRPMTYGESGAIQGEDKRSVSTGMNETA